MASKSKFYIVEETALPEIILKVAEANRLLSSHEAATVNEATRMLNISRSAFYKYRESVMPFNNMMHGRVITFQFLLQDKLGLLSVLLGIFAESNINIQTINSIIPTNGCAVLTITADTMESTVPLEDLLVRLNSIPGVIKADILAG